MEDLATELHIAGLVFMPLGLLNLGMGTLLARNPKFPAGIGSIMQLAGVGFMLAGAVFYFSSLDGDTTLRIGSTVLAIPSVFVILRFIRMQRERRG